LADRVEAVRVQQQALQARLTPVLEKRRSIEQIFTELEGRQSDIERSLAEVAGGGDAVALDIGLKTMTDFVRQSHERCDDIERAAKVVAGLKEDYAGLQARLTPFAAPEDGVVRRVKELSAIRDRLAEEIGALEQTPQGPLAERLQKFAGNKQQLDDRLSQLGVQFTKLASLRGDLADLFANFHRALDVLSGTTESSGGAPIGFTRGRGASRSSPDRAAARDIDGRVAELAAFIAATQSQLDEIEARAAAFAEMKTKLGELQARLSPLDAANGGVASLIEDLKDVRDRLLAKIGEIEQDEDGGLAERVQKFAETKRELEKRVSSLTEQFSKLAMVRNDITGLFEKLSSAVNASSN
jgi:chromosome segregation ATPase